MHHIDETFIARMESFADRMEKVALEEYVAYLHDKRRMLASNFLAGMARGLGMAVGFTVLGAVVVAVLQRIAVDNLPLVGGFLADIIRIVQEKL